MRRLIGIGLLLGAAAAAHGQEEGGYIGISYGSFDYTGPDDFGISTSDDAGTARVLGGYQFNSVYAIEATWAAPDDISETLAEIPDPVLGTVRLLGAAEHEIATVRFIGMAPLDSFSIFGGGGLYDMKATSSFSIENDMGVIDSITEDQSDSGAMVVGGIQFEFERFAVRGEYEWFDTDDIDASLLTVSAILRF